MACSAKQVEIPMTSLCQIITCRGTKMFGSLIIFPCPKADIKLKFHSKSILKVLSSVVHRPK